ncbi:MAG: acetyl-CoA carboxylase carboxyltransferase subunit alpha [Chloroflexi bacterium RIFCSPLOWO2_12_FULL_71_12]|nr:MAG: acetyl-CoA carboxylase carboxyltransferase subunit alpha [Chloroflexi bacterium GWC2_70_10]OGO67316.1 MAG: acetyl-CoA carboxylase carboxyltransferase subunit alpha [Chloroflexi bacterium RIFCSPLOWO2_02_FULL_71_16]OGO74372.1 MAG: acetyl-CoA carboxylase carboxyltransferase subunit alpha [Chloroflexi bacterium RIFCSPLOWO2_12_FULL_71_12]
MRDPIGTIRSGATALGLRRAAEDNGDLPADGLLIVDVSGISGRVSAWDAVKLARDLKRPHALDLIERVFDRFQELHGDRSFRDDPAVVGGIAHLDGHPVVVVGQQKGGSTEENIQRNFGMPHPEGYRKAIRLYRLAERFHLPLVTLIDTPGAYPGPEAEERGQAEAIAKSIETLTRLRTPVVAVVLGEGGSGGALALGVADVVLALENAIYSVISPEGCAAILWRSGTEAERAAKALKLAGPDLLALGIVDGLVPEPRGGAQNDHDATARSVKAAVVAQLDRLSPVPVTELLAGRYERFRRIGVFVEPETAPAAPRRTWWKRVLGR